MKFKKMVAVTLFIALSVLLVAAAIASAATVIDQYSTSNDSHVLRGSAPAWAQSFTGNGMAVGQASFSLKRTGSLTGNVYAKLYSISNGLPATLLATSNPIAAGTIPSSAYTTIYFNFSTLYTVNANTEYVISCEYNGGSSSTYLEIAFDHSSPNGDFSETTSGWVAHSGQEVCFGVLAGSVTSNPAPIANAGNSQVVNVNALVTLDGSASSDPDGQALTYQWSFLSKPAGSIAVLSNSTAVKPTFVADVAGTFTASLAVKDANASSNPSSVNITVNGTTSSPPPANPLPVANAGPDETVTVGQTATLDGSASADPDGQTLTYQWSLYSTPAGSNATLTGSTLVKASFVPDIAGSYVAKLVVSDAGGSSTPDMATITATAAVSSSPPPPSSGNVYYMATNGSDSNSGSITSPWKSLASAVTHLKPGDTLYLRGGTYGAQAVSSIPSGTASARITISGYPGESPIINGGGSGSPLLHDLSNVSYVTFRNMEITNYSIYLIYLYSNCNYMIFENLNIHDIGLSGSGAFISGITIGNEAGSPCTHNIVRYCHCERLGYNINQHHWIYTSANATYNQVYNCFLKDAIAGQIQSDHSPAGGHNQFFNNILVGGQWGWCNYNGETYDEFYNNTCYGNMYCLEQNAGNNNIIRNNIFANWTKAPIDNLASGNTLDHNLWSSSFSGKPAGDITGNPLFVNPSGEDFHLQAGSPAINAGATIGLVTNNFDGVARPPYNIGAY